MLLIFSNLGISTQLTAAAATQPFSCADTSPLCLTAPEPAQDIFNMWNSPQLTTPQHEHLTTGIVQIFQCNENEPIAAVPAQVDMIVLVALGISLLVTTNLAIYEIVYRRAVKLKNKIVESHQLLETADLTPDEQQDLKKHLADLAALHHRLLSMKTVWVYHLLHAAREILYPDSPQNLEIDILLNEAQELMKSIQARLDDDNHR